MTAAPAPAVDQAPTVRCGATEAPMQTNAPSPTVTSLSGSLARLVWGVVQ